MNPLPAVTRRTLAFAVVLFAFVTTIVGLNHGAPTRFLILDLFFGLMFVLAGFVAWERRPEVPYGGLLLAAGAMWFVGSYAPTGWMPFSWLGFTFERYYDVVLALIALTFPGIALRLPGRIMLSGLAVGFLARSASRVVVGCNCVENPIALVQDSVLFGNLQVVTSGLIVACALGVAVLSLARLAQSPPTSREILRPVAIGGTIAALVAAWDATELIALVQTGAPLVRLGEPGDEILSWTIIALVATVPIGYMIGVLRLRRRQGPLASLAVQLQSRPGPNDLQTALRDALRDPDARILLWDRDRDLWLNAERKPGELPGKQSTQSVTLLEHEGGAPYAAILHDQALNEDPHLVAGTTALLRLALDNERLAAQVQDQLNQVRLSRTRLLHASEAERRRIERDLHDGAQQRLIAVALALQEARSEAAKNASSTPFLGSLDNAAAELLSAIEELRELARGIHPAVLTEDGLRVAVASLARRAPLPVTVDVDVEGRLPTAIETTAFYVVAEALTNIARHSQARSAAVMIQRSNGHLQIEISDDGKGGVDSSRGTGLRGLGDRLDAVAGSLSIDSSPAGGTRLRASIPCE